MIIEQLEIILIACIVAAACALPGVFLVLRRVALMSDAISHAILLGIVLLFFAVENIHSPLLILGAVGVGVLTVSLTEWVIATKRVKKDAAIGLVFPVFFSLGVILISKYAGKIHLDQDAVLLGELAFAPFNRLIINTIDLGPISLWVMSGILLLNSVWIKLFYKELKLATFDSLLAHTLGFSPFWIHYSLMTIVSITSVGAFDAVGSILVVALMITPPSAAYLLTESLGKMIALSIGLGIASAIIGYGVALIYDVSIGGAMASASGILFLLALIFSPQKGLFMQYMRHKNQKRDFAIKMLLVQLLYHENTDQESQENTITNMVTHMAWEKSFAHKIARYAIQNKYITRQEEHLHLTNLGREMAKLSIIE